MKHQPPQVAERFSACRVGEVLISAITAAELEYGVVASGVDTERNGAAMHHQPVGAKLIARIVSGSLPLNG